MGAAGVEEAAAPTSAAEANPFGGGFDAGAFGTAFEPPPAAAAAEAAVDSCHIVWIYKR